jgi:hypothetical protein
MKKGWLILLDVRLTSVAFAATVRSYSEAVIRNDKRFASLSCEFYGSVSNDWP